ncbi:glutamate racemase [Amorphus orientalis]|uniref:Glutamate racemase n=1 Tax=Amorphus orientalis TaxID=649198 RepID=A0AAE3VT53_9HYPH|nr:glutamate racemase [Amorphus orientalis]MDQ0317463.1 glutamate racemase [Amorphus orientalis]
MSRPILVFDSGLGGTTVLAAIATRLPDTRFVYLADDAGFPYGAWTDEAGLVARIVDLVTAEAAASDACCAVIACNTAATVALPALRAALDIPVVGTVPAIKPAAERSRSGLASVLATPATVARDYTRELIRAHGGDVRFTLIGAAPLATLAEAHAAGAPVDSNEIARIVAPCFVEDGDRRTDVVVLACTHYPLLSDLLPRIAPWPVDWIDPAPAIARRVAAVLDVPETDERAPDTVDIAARFTSGRARAPEIAPLVDHRIRALATR